MMIIVACEGWKQGFFTSVDETSAQYSILHTIQLLGGHVQGPESKRLHRGEDWSEPQSQWSHRACQRLHFTYYFSLVIYVYTVTSVFTTSHHSTPAITGSQFFNPKTSAAAILIHWLRSARLQLQLSCNMEFNSYFH